ncbi:MAG: RNA chaperone Hfq [Terriglobia bacterium]
MKKPTREPLARNEPLIRKKKPLMMPSEEAEKREVRPNPPSLDNGSVRVFRPSEPKPPELTGNEIGHRKLIRTTMEEVRRRQAEGKLKLSEKATSSPVRGQHAPDLTNAEYQYLSGLVQSKARVVVKLMNGETVEGWIEYIDRNFIRLTREGQPNLFIYKHDIKYLEEVKKATSDARR